MHQAMGSNPGFLPTDISVFSPHFRLQSQYHMKVFSCAAPIPSQNYTGCTSNFFSKEREFSAPTTDLLPLAYDRELKDLVFLYKCLNNYTDLNILNFVSFISHGRTRRSNSFNLTTPSCKTSTFQASYFNRTVKLWNYVCTLSPPSKFSNPTAFQTFVAKHMFSLVRSVFDVNSPCTWSIVRSCPCH